MAGKVIHVGFDTSTKLVDALRSGEIQGLSLQHPFNMGYLSLKTAVAAIRGEEVQPVIDTGVFMATPDTMDDPDIRALLLHDWSALLAD